MANFTTRVQEFVFNIYDWIFIKKFELCEENIAGEEYFESYDAERVNACSDINEARKKVGNRKVVSASLIDDTCQESYPCCGHGGIKLILEDSEIVIQECGSVSIGAIHYYFLPNDKEFHCRGYVSRFLMDDGVFFYKQ